MSPDGGLQSVRERKFRGKGDRAAGDGGDRRVGWGWGGLCCWNAFFLILSVLSLYALAPSFRLSFNPAVAGSSAHERLQ